MNALTENRRTPLHYSAFKGHVEVVQSLLKHNADTSIKETKLRETPLHRAAAGGHLAIVELLIKNNADLHALDQHRRSSLHKASIFGHHELIVPLITSGSAPGLKDKAGKTACERSANTSTRLAFDRYFRSKSNSLLLPFPFFFHICLLI